MPAVQMMLTADIIGQTSYDNGECIRMAGALNHIKHLDSETNSNLQMVEYLYMHCIF